MIGELGGCNPCGRLCPRAGRGQSLRSGGGASWPPGPCVVTYTRNAACFLHSFAVSLPCLGESWVLSGGCEFPSRAPPGFPRPCFFSHVGPLPHGQCNPRPRAGPESAVASLPTDRTPHGILALGPLCSSACQEPPSAHSLALPLDSGALSKPILPSHPGGRSAFLWLCFWSQLPVTC